MAEFLLRGYNAAIPEVDVGDDVFVVDDGTGTLWRVQVKTAVPKRGKKQTRAPFNFSMKQLRESHPVGLTYVLALREDHQWRFIVLPSAKLLEMRVEFEETSKQKPKKKKKKLKKKGKKRKPGKRKGSAGQQMTMSFVLTADDVVCWGHSFRSFINNWETFPELSTGRGARKAAGRTQLPRNGSRPSP